MFLDRALESSYVANLYLFKIFRQRVRIFHGCVEKVILEGHVGSWDHSISVALRYVVAVKL